MINESSVDIHAIQELQARGDKYWRNINKVKQTGRHAVGTQSVAGPNGSDSSGAALFVDKKYDTSEPDYGNEPPPKGEEHKRFVIEEGRAVAIVVNGWAGIRLLVISLYFDVNDKLGTRNMNTLYEVGKWITRMGLPYVLCADYNNTVASIGKLNWLSAIGGAIIAPSLPTYTATNQEEGTIIDFFIVKRWMAPYANAVTANRKPNRHRPMLLILTQPINKLYEYTISKPTAFPQEITKGANREHCTQPNWSYVRFLERCGREEDGYSLEKHTAYIMKGIEDELINKFGLNH